MMTTSAAIIAHANVFATFLNLNVRCHFRVNKSSATSHVWASALCELLTGGLAHRETGRFPGGPLLHEVFRAPGRTREFISLIIS